jgi:Acyl-protein synthetase, LuxE
MIDLQSSWPVLCRLSSPEGCGRLAGGDTPGKLPHYLPALKGRGKESIFGAVSSPLHLPAPAFWMPDPGSALMDGKLTLDRQINLKANQKPTEAGQKSFATLLTLNPPTSSSRMFYPLETESAVLKTHPSANQCQPLPTIANLCHAPGGLYLHMSQKTQKTQQTSTKSVKLTRHFSYETDAKPNAITPISHCRPAIPSYNDGRLWRKTSLTKHRMTAALSNFAARLGQEASWLDNVHEFNELALELFALQFTHNPAYRKICEARRVTPDKVEHWTQVPFVPTATFKELELSSIPPQERTAIFHSSGTTEQKPSRHFHCAGSMKVYESACWTWFDKNVLAAGEKYDLLVLTPPSTQVPHSSLIHMFETVRQGLDTSESAFVGKPDESGAWVVDFEATLAALNTRSKPKLILGTAFSFVHLLNYLAEKDLRFQLPYGSRIMETGGYKNRSRSLPKARLHFLLSELLGVSRENIICEYGMSELSSQAYDTGPERQFRFPPWARVQIISPETGREVADGETGLIRLFDLANIFSVAAIQTEDLGVRRGRGFELIGRAALAEARGCSLMTA